ncbi:phage tail protein [Citrobacter freundii]|uniref:phage tail fiber protein n=1 Tax=Citrobacter freundii TaxID=546 RepID=UPI0024E1534C|nr:phage tail protein [Citrobacter freundii]MDT7355659.1 phage tail protein [Citrobacter freundii]MEB0828241.1 phage tail protein [Citrobacter freundii]MEB2700285.1 phage tail protein [Citrobacter freundii]WOP95178.1 phage tail protein [Citrobacter freundii]
MSAGTLTLTNNSAAVAGSGTAFTTEVAAGDFIVVTVGGVPYTLPVKSVEGGTELTLVSNYTGPTQSGAAWSAVPRVALNMVTAALVAQSAEALRGLNYDKQNWQQVFSDTGNITVRLPDGSSYTGPAWGGITTALSGKADKTALEDYAKKGSNSDITSLSGLTTALGVTQGGTGGNNQESACNGIGTLFVKLPASTSYGTAVMKTSIGYFDKDSSPNVNGSGAPFNYAEIMTIAESGESPNFSQIAFSILSEAGPRFRQRFSNPARLTDWRDFLIRGLNAIADTNGFYKTSSPVIKIWGDGTSELNDESEGATVVRMDTGVYKVSGVMGFNSSPEWGGVEGGYSVPQNGNGLPLIWLDYEIASDGDITIRTYHRTHSNAPGFARNLIGTRNDDGSFTETVKDGEPVDIPAGRWIDLRVEMPHNSPWNIKQLKAQEAREKAERERQQNQQETQL